MKILILGSGGVGGFLGGLLARAGETVWFVARGDHLRAMKTSGLRLQTTAGDRSVPPGKMIENPENAGVVDAVLVCVKSYDTKEAIRRAAPAITPQTAILTLQNGMDNGDVIRASITSGLVFEGAIYVSARIASPGVILETGGFSRLVFGHPDGPATGTAEMLASSLMRSGIKTELRPKIRPELWRKMAFITSVGSMTALTRLSQGEMLTSPETMDIVFAAMKETEAVAAAQGNAFEPLVREKVIEGLARFDPGTRSSMYYDLINQKPLEIESLNGMIVRLGRKLNIPTPIHQMIYASLIPYHRRHLAMRDA